MLHGPRYTPNGQSVFPERPIANEHFWGMFERNFEDTEVRETVELFSVWKKIPRQI